MLGIILLPKLFPTNGRPRHPVPNNVLVALFARLFHASNCERRDCPLEMLLDVDVWIG